MRREDLGFLEPRLLARLGAPFAGCTISRLFDRAMGNLGGYLERRAPAR
ncbi:MAG TPA: hypothetical protein VEM57_09270 [Candidatus Binatus sp.]|nr:hypothetical protein [Candidatus Binatus sp.]